MTQETVLIENMRPSAPFYAENNSCSFNPHVALNLGIEHVTINFTLI